MKNSEQVRPFGIKRILSLFMALVMVFGVLVFSESVLEADAAAIGKGGESSTYNFFRMRASYNKLASSNTQDRYTNVGTSFTLYPTIYSTSSGYYIKVTSAAAYMGVLYGTYTYAGGQAITEYALSVSGVVGYNFTSSGSTFSASGTIGSGQTAYVRYEIVYDLYDSSNNLIMSELNGLGYDFISCGTPSLINAGGLGGQIWSESALECTRSANYYHNGDAPYFYWWYYNIAWNEDAYTRTTGGYSDEHDGGEVYGWNQLQSSVSTNRGNCYSFTRLNGNVGAIDESGGRINWKNNGFWDEDTQYDGPQDVYDIWNPGWSGFWRVRVCIHDDNGYVLTYGTDFEIYWLQNGHRSSSINMVNAALASNYQRAYYNTSYNNMVSALNKVVVAACMPASQHDTFRYVCNSIEAMNSAYSAAQSNLAAVAYTTTFSTPNAADTTPVTRVNLAQSVADTGSISAPTASSSSFYRTGYTFTGWTDTVDNTFYPYVAGYGRVARQVNLNKNHALRADWRENTYRLVYNKNDGLGATQATDYFGYDQYRNILEPSIFNLSNSSIQRQGYTFKEWNTAANGTGTAYAANQQIRRLTPTDGATINLYAIWTPNEYQIEFTPYPEATTIVGGVTGAIGNATTVNAVYDTAVTMPGDMDANGVAFRRDGYALVGWAVSLEAASTLNDDGSVGIVSYPVGSTPRNLTAQAGATVTLYPVWRANEYTVVFHYGDARSDILPEKAIASGGQYYWQSDYYSADGEMYYDFDTVAEPTKSIQYSPWPMLAEMDLLYDDCYFSGWSFDVADLSGLLGDVTSNFGGSTLVGSRVAINGVEVPFGQLVQEDDPEQIPGTVGTIHLYANWDEAVDPESGLYRTSFFYDGGAVVEGEAELGRYIATGTKYGQPYVYDDATRVWSSTPESALVPLPTLEKFGYTFNGWYLMERIEGEVFDYDTGDTLPYIYDFVYDEQGDIDANYLVNEYTVKTSAQDEREIIGASFEANEFYLAFMPNDANEGFTYNSMHDAYGDEEWVNIGTIASPQYALVQSYDSPFTMPLNIYKKFGYTFMGWSFDGNGEIAVYDGTAFDTAAAVDALYRCADERGIIELYAEFEVNVYDVYFDVGIDAPSMVQDVYTEAAYDEKEVTFGTEYQAVPGTQETYWPEEPVIPNYSFMGWYYAGEDFDDINANGIYDEGEPFADANDNAVWDAGNNPRVNPDDTALEILPTTISDEREISHTLKAYWDPDDYDITFDTTEGYFPVSIYDEVLPVEQRKSITVTVEFGYTFDYIRFGTGETTYDIWDGADCIPVFPGFTFLGWFKTPDGSDTAISGSEIITPEFNNTTLYARWSANTYYINLDYNIGTEGGIDITDPNLAGIPTRLEVVYGETFGDGLVQTGAPDAFTEAAFYPTKANLEDTYTYTYDFSELGFEDEFTTNYIRPGYTFLGWYPIKVSGGNEITTDTAVPNYGVDFTEVTLYARWQADTNTPYLVKHYYNEIVGGEPSYEDFMDTPFKIELYTGITGYEVYADGYKVIDDYGRFTAEGANNYILIAGDGSSVLDIGYYREIVTIAYYADYDIYDDDTGDVIDHIDGAIHNKTEDFADAYYLESYDTNWFYDDEANPFVEFPECYCEGYTFAGWYTGPNGTGDQITADSKITSDYIELFAYYTINSYFMTFKYNDNVTEDLVLELNYKTIFDLPGDPGTNPYEGYHFGIWCLYQDDEGNLSGRINAETYQVPARDVTFYLKWLPNPYEVYVDLHSDRGNVTVFADGLPVSMDADGYGTVYRDQVVTVAYAPVAGYRFAALYRMADETGNVVDLIEGTLSETVTTNIYIKVAFEKIYAEMRVNVTNGTVFGKSTLALEEGSVVTVIANAPPEGYEFVYWASDAAGENPVSTSRVYSFTLVAPIDLFAIFQAEAVVIPPTVTVASTAVAKSGTKYRVTFTGAAVIPDGATLDSYGMLFVATDASGKEDTFVIGTAKIGTATVKNYTSTSMSASTGQYKIAITSVPKKTTVSARFYLNYTIGGESATTYSDIAVTTTP